MEEHTIQGIQELIVYLEANRDRLVIDTDTHPTDLGRLNGELLARYQAGPDYYHGRPISTEDLIAEMNMAGVDMALSWQNPAALIYGDDQEENFEHLRLANAYIRDSAIRYPTRIIPAGWTDPKALGLDRALKLTEILMLEFGFFIVKMNPAQNAYPIDSESVMTVVDRIVELGGVPAFHYGADTAFTPPKGLEKIAQRHPDTPIIAVHMGGGGAGYLEGEATYIKTRSLGLKYPNLKFPLSAKRDTHIESDLITYQLAGAPFSRNLFCASDAPYGRLTWNFGGYHRMLDSLIDSGNHTDIRVREHSELFDQDMKTNFLGRNFADFTIEYYSKFLQQHTKLSPI